MALAIKFQSMVDQGEARDYADLARLDYVTRARLTQIMNLLLRPRHPGSDSRQLQRVAREIHDYREGPPKCRADHQLVGSKAAAERDRGPSSIGVEDASTLVEAGQGGTRPPSF
jgi:hypothetical protein